MITAILNVLIGEFLTFFFTFVGGVSLLSLIGFVWGIRKKKRILPIIAGIVFLATLYWDFMFVEFLSLRFDSLRGWELRVPVQTGQYIVTLVQKPGNDFYDSFLEIQNADHKMTQLGIDLDDRRWWNPHIVKHDGRIYFLRGIGIINADSPYIDIENDVVYTGYSKQTYILSQLYFK